MLLARPICCLLVAASASLAPSLPANAGETLRVLAWPGFADSDLVQDFEKRFGVNVEVSFVNSDDMLRKKISANQGSDFDVFAASTSELQYYIAQKLIVPLQLSAIPNTAHQLPRFRKLNGIPGIAVSGHVFAIPYTYSEMGLIYDRKQFKKAPISMAALWDPKYKGRILAVNSSSHNFSIASLLLGGLPFQIRDTQFDKVAEHLIALRRNVLTFYTQPEESVHLFHKHKAALLFANDGKKQFKQLRDAGADVAYVIPREGALARLDCWAITRGAKNRQLAENWINYTLEANVSSELTRRHGLSNTIHASPPENNSAKIIWLKPVENEPRRTALWRHIISGDSPWKFMTSQNSPAP